MADGFFTKIKRAFKWHWNLLAVGAGVAVAFLSGEPDIVLPLVAAGELSYLGFLGLNARFQNVLLGMKLGKGKQGARATRLSDLLGFLSESDQERFARLQERCRVMTQLRKRMSGGGVDAGGTAFQAETLDKLLWLFLKLLHHKAGLERFLQQTSEADFVADLEDAEAKLAAATAGGRSERLIASLNEKVETLKQRMGNYANARENLEILEAELDKTEQKIAHICEVGMTSRDGSELSFQIDGITESIAVSERALEGLQVSDLLEEDAAPAFLGDESAMNESVSLLEMES